MVINMLNMGSHSNLQQEAFNGFSEQIRAYTNRRLPQEAFTRRGTALRAIVDPYAYRERLLQPKLIILATNDAYWPVDSLNLYWNDLRDDKFILFLPNSGHSVEDYPRVIATMAAMVDSVTGGKKLPRLAWSVKEHLDSATIELTTDVVPRGVRLWSAAADSRDFRKAEWIATPVSASGDDKHIFVGKLVRPTDGCVAMFLEAEFPGPLPFNLATTLHVFDEAGSRDSTDLIHQD
jgi:PhoPQ-activated pathogenicity-related protein